MTNFSQIVHMRRDGTQDVLAHETNEGNEEAFTLTHTLRVRFPVDDGSKFQCQARNKNGLSVEEIAIVVQGRPYKLSIYNLHMPFYHYLYLVFLSTSTSHQSSRWHFYSTSEPEQC